MINLVLYGALMFCCFVAIVTGRRTLIYAAALLMPAIQVMPSLAGPFTSAPNLIVMGLVIGAFWHMRRRPAAPPRSPAGAASGTAGATPGSVETDPRAIAGTGPGSSATAEAAGGPFFSPGGRDATGAARAVSSRRAVPILGGIGAMTAAAGGSLVLEGPSAGWRERDAIAPRPMRAPKLPLRGAIVFLTLMLLLGLGIRALNEMGGAEYLFPLSQAAKDTWYRITAFVVYALIFRQLVAEPTDQMLRKIVTLCQISFAVECAITMVERALDIGRATAHLEEANRAGAYFAAASAFFFAAFLLTVGNRRWLFFGGWLLAVGAVFNSLSRGAMAATGVSCCVVLAFALVTGRLTGKTKLILVVLLVVAAINAPFLVPDRVKHRVLETFGGAPPAQGEEVDLDSSAEERLLLWSIGWMLVKDNPFGYGALTYQDLVLPYHDKAKVAHNIYLQLLVENGVEGLLALLILVASVLFLLGKSYFRARSPDQAVLALSLIGWWTAHLTAHFFVNSFFHLQVVGQFWMMLACLFALQQADAAVPAGSAEPAAGLAAGSRAGTPASRRPAWS